MERNGGEAQQARRTIAGNPAEIYESYLVPAIFLPWSEELLCRTVPRPGERVLDVACGTGAVTRRVAPLVGATGSVVGLDVSPLMLAVAGTLPSPPGAAIAWQQGNATALPFSDVSFDLVLCQQGLQFFPDRPLALREMRRVLDPGGRVGISVWRGPEHHPLFAALDEAGERHLGAPLPNVPLSLGDAEEVRALLEGAGFRDLFIEPIRRRVRFPSPERFVRLSFLGAAAIMPEFARLDEAARDSLVDAVRSDLDATLRTYLEGDELVFPMEAHVAVAHP